MQNKLKLIFSILAIGLFVLLTIASFGPDGSTNTTVDIKECMEKPDVSGNLQVVIHHKDNSGAVIPFANGRIYITEQNVISPNVGCNFFTDFNQIDFVTDVNGRYTYSKPFIHNCDKDLNRIQVEIMKTSAFTGFDQVQVAYYSTTNVTFNAVSVKLIDL